MENYEKEVETKHTEKCDVTKLQLSDITKVWKLESIDYDLLLTNPLKSTQICFDGLKDYGNYVKGHLQISYKMPYTPSFEGAALLLCITTDLKDVKFILDNVILGPSGNILNSSTVTIRTVKGQQSTYDVFLSNLRYNTITIICKIKFGLHVSKQGTYEVNCDIFENHEPHKSQSDLMTLLDDNGFKVPDVFISGNDGHTIRVHESILTTAIPKFKELIEPHHKIIKLNESSASVLEMIRFIYFGEIRNMDKIAPDLLSLAYRFEVNHIKQKCELYLVRNITIQNTIEIFKVANMWNISNLGKQSLIFMKNNYSSIVDTEEFKKLKSQNIPISQFIKYLL